MVKKIILYLFLLIPFLFIKNVYAEELNIYNYTQYNSYSWSDYNSSYNIQNFKFNAYDNTFVINNNMSDYYNIVLYDKKNDLYLISMFNFQNFTCDTSFSFSQYCLINDNWVAHNIGLIFSTTLSLKDESSYWNNIFSNQTPSVKEQNGFYLTQVNLRTWKNVFSYINNNYEDFEVVYSSFDKTYANNGNFEIPLKSNSPEEPDTPEEPEEPEPVIPPYNFNNNKYYVPNYTDENCVEIIDKDTIRVFENETTDFYTDYYINSNYISRQGQVDLNYEKHCSNLQFTDIRYYGNDMPQILFILVCILTFTIGFPYVLYKRFRKR